jgi:DNA (cytosine-5)-methyltransferase 1
VNKKNSRQLKFIDLFAGLGGFHLALTDLGYKCVFASEINPELRDLYEVNYGLKCHGDINAVSAGDIPKHDIICAGFPCQPFSKAGKQFGLDDPNNGNFFNRIMEIADHHETQYIFLENVPNLKSHDGGETWRYIQDKLNEKYHIREQIISPHIYGIPQHRSRIYIVCKRKSKRKGKDVGLGYFEFPKGQINPKLSITTILEKNPKEYRSIKKESLHQLEVWQEFLTHVKMEEVPGFPIWAMEFGATYPYEGKAPIKQDRKSLMKHLGAFGEPISGHSIDEVLECLPNYARSDNDEFPNWKKYYIRANREFYNKNKKWLDIWIPKVRNFENSHLKLEWNCGNKTELNLMDKIIQFRPSGIRVKMPTYSPALVLASTQIPIFPWLNRYMTIKEAAKLQCMENLNEYPKTAPKAFRAFGNAVNVCVVKLIAKNLLCPNEK